ncbi:MAG TPA: LuxR C-terminal-related transcriptional regulator [Candidatus Limnocylindrales bacterium]|nr:LuxR C-terminal-related transcriptional regulator [Candidatus Limnocylindrales bacterium]
MPATMNSARFVGRDAAFVRLAPALEAASDGEATTVLLDGPGGVGVSRFVAELGRRVAGLAEPFVVVRGRSFRPGSDDPYGAIIRALRPVFHAVDDAELAAIVGPAAEDVVRLFPEVVGRLSSAGALPGRPTSTALERRQGRVLEGLLGVVGRLAERQPVLFVIEDLHDADAGSRAFVSFMSRIRRAQRVCLIGTWQPDELTRDHPLSRTLAEMAAVQERGPARISIPPLERAELAELVQAIEGERPTASALVLVADRSRGLPLVAEELLGARRELSDTSLTGSFADIVIARLARYGPECRRVLRLLALAGRPIDRDELAETAAAFELTADRLPPRSSTRPRHGDGALDPDLAAGLEEALGAGILVEETEGVAFRHEHIRRAAAADLLPRLRIRHHLALAAGLVAQPNEAASHWLAAHVPDRAFAAAVDAAGRAEAAHAPEDALAALEVALALVDPSARAGEPVTIPLPEAPPDGGDAQAGADGSLRTRTPARSTRGERATTADARSEDGRARADAIREVATPLQLRAAESAFAAGRPARAVAYLEAILGSFDERRDRVALGLLHERLGRYRRAAGDRTGALVALERAVDLVPDGPTLERATVLAALAQATMLDGSFSRAETLARDAMRIGAACGHEGEAIVVHATTTLGVALGWGDAPEAGVALLEEARGLAEQAGDADEVFRVYANLTTVLDLVGRRPEAVEVAYEGIEASRRAGLEAVYGNFLRGNASDSLYLLGRWAESSAISATALEWSPAGVAFVRPIDSLAVVEIETQAGEAAGRRLGQMLVELETVSDAQHAVPIYRAAASLALWQGDHADAGRAAGRGWDLVKDSGDWSLLAKMAATVAEVDSMAAADAGARRDIATIASIRGRSRNVVKTATASIARSGVGPTIGSRREADAWLALATAHRDRLEGRDDPAAWDRLAAAWEALANPYEVAKARWRQAEAILASGEGRAGRGHARPVLEEAAAIGLTLGARPLLREIRQLAGRAMIRLPESVDALLDAPDPRLAGGASAALGDGGERGDGTLVAVGPGPDGQAAGAGNGSTHGNGTGGESAIIRGVVGEAPVSKRDTFGLSRREREVLALMAEGRTNREIGERLFISQKTVGVHVGNILAKLGVSGRVEAAAVAIRLGLTEPSAAGTSSGR